MKIPLGIEAGFLDDRDAADPASAVLLDALRARRVAVTSLSPEAILRSAGLPDADRSRSFVATREIELLRRATEASFGFVAGIADTADHKRALREAGADLVVPSLAGLALQDIDAWFAGRQHARPTVPANRGAIAGRLSGRTPALFFDYDGTLTPIVERPELAILAPEMRRALSDLAGRFPTVIVSGRARQEVARLIGLEQLIYAGSHGFDIAGPPAPAGPGSEAVPGASPWRANTPIRHEVAAEFKPEIGRAAAALETALSTVPGALVEDKRYAVAVHYRQVAADRIAEIEAAVDLVGASCPGLKKTYGKKVLELRPAIEWDKGQAVLWLLEVLGLDREEVVPIYLGDDTTDEDAFLVLRDRGVTALVARTPRPTAADYSLQDSDEVGDLLRLIGNVGGPLRE